MNHDRYKSLIERQIISIRRAEWQTKTFHKCFAELDASGQKVAEPQIAAWLTEHRIKSKRGNSNWSPKTVADRLFIDQRLDIERTLYRARDMIEMYREEGIAEKLERTLRFLNESMPSTGNTIDQAVEMIAIHHRDHVDEVARKLRGNRTFLEV